MRRGYLAVGIYRPKHEVNVGSVVRTAHLYGASMIFTVGDRYRRQASDTGDSTQHVPLVHFDTADQMFSALSAPVVAVELAPSSVRLGAYQHRESAAYLFGAEDTGIPADVLAGCAEVVQIEAPRPWSMNVANAAAVVMHDRYVSGDA